MANAYETAVYLDMPPNYVGEERREAGAFENHWVRKASPNSNGGSNC